MEAKGASTTWAVVVGIDVYEEPRFKDLEGAALDAVAFVKWLRKIGVEDKHIIFHAAPNEGNKEVVASLGLPVLGCTFHELVATFKGLKKLKGAKLVVYLAGHGLHEPAEGRAFITSDAVVDDVQNLGLDWFGRYLRTLNFPSQHVIMDGCMNTPFGTRSRPPFKPAAIPAAPEPVATRRVSYEYAAAAEMGQQASEDGTGGRFTKLLLQTIDPEKLDAKGVDVDTTDGSLRVSLRKVVEDVIRATFSDLGLTQRPYWKSEGEVAAPESFVDLVPAEVVRFSVFIDPPEAVGWVRRISLDTDRSDGSHVYPKANRTEVPQLITTAWPKGAAVYARCDAKNGWISSPRESPGGEIQTDNEVVFTLDEQAPVQSGQVVFVGPMAGRQAAIEPTTGGIVANLLTEDQMDRVIFAVNEWPTRSNTGDLQHLLLNFDRSTLPPAEGIMSVGDVLFGLGMPHTSGDLDIHLNGTGGAIITCTPEYTHLLEPLGEVVMDALSTHMVTPTVAGAAADQVGLRMRLRPSIRMPEAPTEAHWHDYINEIIGADETDFLALIGYGDPDSTGVWLQVAAAEVAQLVGFSHDEPVLSVGDVELTMREALANPFVPLSPGPATVSLRLPWGVWKERLVIAEGERVDLQLPAQVGTSPLRVTSLDPRRLTAAVDLALPLPGWTILTGGDKLVPVIGGSSPSDSVPFERTTTPAPWRGTMWRPPQEPSAATARIRTARTVLETSVLSTGPVAVRLAAPYRAEPLSTTPSPHWDTLIGAGRLEAVSVGQIVADTWETWTEPPFGVAVAYACLAQRNDDLLTQVLDSLDGPALEAPDMTFLRAARDWRNGTHDPETEEQLTGLVGRIPWFQWGLGVGITAATHYGADALKAELEFVAARAAPESTWLLWEPELDLGE